MNYDEIIETYTMVDYNNRGDIKGQAHYVTINGKLLELVFEQFHSKYLSLWLLPMIVVKCPLVNTKKNAPKRTTVTL